MAQFFNITDVGDACFTFLACFEGPRVPNYSARMSNAQTISDAIGGGPVPPGPDPPGPTPASDDYIIASLLMLDRVRYKR